MTVTHYNQGNGNHQFYINAKRTVGQSETDIMTQYAKLKRQQDIAKRHWVLYSRFCV